MTFTTIIGAPRATAHLALDQRYYEVHYDTRIRTCPRPPRPAPLPANRTLRERPPVFTGGACCHGSSRLCRRLLGACRLGSPALRAPPCARLRSRRRRCQRPQRDCGSALPCSAQPQIEAHQHGGSDEHPGPHRDWLSPLGPSARSVSSASGAKRPCPALARSSRARLSGPSVASSSPPSRRPMASPTKPPAASQARTTTKGSPAVAAWARKRPWATRSRVAPAGARGWCRPRPRRRPRASRGGDGLAGGLGEIEVASAPWSLKVTRMSAVPLACLRMAKRVIWRSTLAGAGEVGPAPVPVAAEIGGDGHDLAEAVAPGGEEVCRPRASPGPRRRWRGAWSPRSRQRAASSRDRRRRGSGGPRRRAR